LADRGPKSFKELLLSWMPFAFPAIGGTLGMILVNSYPTAFINPVVAVGGGIFLGWAISALIFRFIEYR